MSGKNVYFPDWGYTANEPLLAPNKMSLDTPFLLNFFVFTWGKLNNVLIGHFSHVM